MFLILSKYSTVAPKSLSAHLLFVDVISCFIIQLCFYSNVKLGQRAGTKFYEDCEKVAYFCARIYCVLKFPPSPCTKAEVLIAEQNSTL